MIADLGVDIELYHNGYRLAGMVAVVKTYRSAYTAVSLPGVAFHDSAMAPQVRMECLGEAFPGWLSFRVSLENSDGQMMGAHAAPFLLFNQPAQFPSVLVLPSRDPQFPGALTLVFRVTGVIEPPADEPQHLYVLWSNKHEAWWKPDRAGYTNDINEAGRYNVNTALDIVAQSAWHANLSKVTCMVAAPENWENTPE